MYNVILRSFKRVILVILGTVIRFVSIVKQKYRQSRMHKRLLRADKWRVRSVSVISFLILLIFILGLFTEPVRASSTWQQTDWSGGSGSSTSNQYASASNIDGSSGTSATLSKGSNLFTNSSFDSNITGWHGVNGTYDTVTKRTGAGSLKINSPATTSLPFYNRTTVSIPTGTDSRRVLAGDFNGDSLDDVVSMEYLTGKAGVYINNGQGGFNTGVVYDSPASQSSDMTVNDFNNDGYDDIIILGTNQTFAKLMSNGDGTFTRTVETKTNGASYNAIVSADFDNDGDIDLLLRSNLGGAVYSLYTNNGSGSFGSASSYSGTLGITPYTDGMTALDFNGDGFMDVAITVQQGGCHFRVLLNNGGAGFLAEQDATITYCNSNGSAFAIERANMNNDQYDDLIVLSSTSSGTGGYPTFVGRATIILGNSSGSTTAQDGYTTTSSQMQLTAFDFSGDSKDDVVITNQGLNNYLAYTNSGTGTLGSPVTGTTGAAPYSDSFGDFNGDGKNDLITLDRTDNVISTYINKRGGDAYTQSINVGNTSTYQLEAYAYTSGAAVTSADATLYANGQPLTTTYTSVGAGWYKLSASITGANAKRNYGVQALPGKTVYVDDMELYKYNSPGVLTSNIFDLGYGGDWGALTYSTSGGGTVAVKVRTGNSSDMSDAPAFSSCSAISSGSDLTGKSCITNNDRYVQYQVTLTYVNGQTAPVLNSVSIEYSAWDTTLPDTNASNITMKKASGGSNVSSNGWTNGATPYFSWDAGADNPGGSGIKGYCLYLGQTQGSDPVSTKGLLGTSPLDTDGACQFAVSSEYVNLATSGYLGTALTTSNNPYYLEVKVIDNANNVFSGSPAEFQFRFDDTKPTNPNFVTAPSQFVANRAVSLTWPTSGGDEASDANSGLAGLQYRIGNATPWYGDTHTSGGDDDSDLLANDGEYTTINDPDFANINEGNNIIYFRTWDNAGNVSTTYTTTVVKLNTSSPSSPQNVTATPSTNTSNSFAFSWSPPATFTGSSNNLTYCYTINTLPTNNTCTYTAAGVTSLSAGSFATQPGDNTFYVVAKDEADNINYATAASTTFTANTSAPGLPLNADIVDISVKSSNNWRLALSWDQPSVVGAGVSSYKIYRSTDDLNFTNVASTSGTSYVDAGLTFEQQYYYKVKACDSANNCGAYSTTVNDKPTGKYTEPANATSDPKVSGISTRKATIDWSTDRGSDSRIQYGIKSGQYFSTEAAISDQVTSHEVPLNNLSAGTTYYAKARWTDEDGNTGSSAEFTFRTAAAPQVKEVDTDPSLTTADIRFTSKDAAKVKIYYGQNESFGGVTSLNTSLSESKYSTSLSGLNDGTKYFFKINTLDADGNEYEGNVYSFTTPPRPKISNLRFQPVKDKPSSTQKVSWETNVPSNSELSYGIGSLGSTIVSQKLTTNHELIISGLFDDSTYALVARSRDANGNQAISDRQTFKTDLDTRPPKVSNVVLDSSIRGTGTEARGQVVLSWKTDEPATSQVAYGEGSSGFLSSSTSEDGKLTTDHVVVVSDLSTSRVYHFEPRSYDKARNEAKGEQKVAIIGRASENVLSIIFNALQQIFGIN